MSLLVGLIVKGLALLNDVLDYFVTISGSIVTGDATCGFEYTIYNATMTTCGETFIDNLMGLGYGLVELAPDLIGALFAI